MAPPLVTALRVRELGSAQSFDRFVARWRRSGEPGTWWLDSARTDPMCGRFSFAGCSPYAWLSSRGTRHELQILRNVRPDLSVGDVSFDSDPIDALRGLIPRETGLGFSAIPFIGGAVGVFGYELAAAWERLPLAFAREGDAPDQCFALVDRLYVADHVHDQFLAVGLGFSTERREAEVAADRAVAELVATGFPPGLSPDCDAAPEFAGDAELPDPEPSLPEDRYRAAVHEILEAIGQGAVYQVCLTQRLTLPYAGDPFSLYRRMRGQDPTPFSAYLELPGWTVLSSSPERFLRVDGGGVAESRPIKGTSRRAANPAEDLRSRQALLDSEKERAENLMIVDLVRNDLGRVCEPGSVGVPQIWSVEAYESVFQLVSTIRGRLRGDCDALDAVRATLPPGSMTGAPKIAAVTLAKRVERTRRGFYSGALGYLDIRGGLDLAVVIRTAIHRPGELMLHAGGAVVADSTAAGEWREMWLKLLSIRRAAAEPRNRACASAKRPLHEGGAA